MPFGPRDHIRRKTRPSDSCSNSLVQCPVSFYQGTLCSCIPSHTHPLFRGGVQFMHHTAPGSALTHASRYRPLPHRLIIKGGRLGGAGDLAPKLPPQARKNARLVLGGYFHCLWPSSLPHSVTPFSLPPQVNVNAQTAARVRTPTLYAAKVAARRRRQG